MPRRMARRNRFRTDPQPLPLPRLQIVTCGVKHAGLEGLWGEVLHVGLSAFVRRWTGRRPVLQIDARVFGDPSRDLRAHCGRHPGIIARMVHHQAFGGWLTGVFYDFAAILGQWGKSVPYQDIMFVLVYCRSGKHRAVAASEILSHVVMSVESMECLPAIHCTLRPHYCHCLDCRPDRPQPPFLVTFKEEASLLWDALRLP